MLRLPDAEAQEEMAAAEVERNGWTVDETERTIDRMLNGPQVTPRRGTRKSPPAFVRVFKDMRLFRNSIMTVVRDMERTGLVVDVEETVRFGSVRGHRGKFNCPCAVRRSRSGSDGQE